MSKENVGVFARPCWPDTAVNRRFPYLMDYLLWMGDEIVSHARETDMEVHDKTREDVTRANIERQLRDVDPIFFFHASHGGKNKLTGQGMSNLICSPGTSLCSKPNHTVLSDRVVYTLSCSSANQLGPAVIQADGISYIGYAHYLSIIVVERSDADEAFKDIWTSGVKELIDGKTTGEAYNKIKQRYQYWIEYWKKMPKSYLKTIMLNALAWDDRYLTLLGKKGVIPIPGKETGIAGTVIDQSKEPIVGATVTTDKGQSAKTDESGKYKLTKVPPGDRRVSASRKPDCESASKSVAVKEGKVTTADFVLICTPTKPGIEGTVIDKESGEPIAGAKVTTDMGQSDTTDASGKYKLTKVPPGDRIVAAFKPDCGCACISVAVKEGEVTLAEDLVLTCQEKEFVIADCAKGLGLFDQECKDKEGKGYPIIDKQVLYEGKQTCKAIDMCGIQAHAGYYMIGSGGKEFEFDIDKYPSLYLTMKAEKGTDTCLLLMVHDKKPKDFMRRFVAIGKTPSGNCGCSLAKDYFTIKDDNKWHDYTYDLRKLRGKYPDAETVRIVQFYSGKLCNGVQHAFHFSSLEFKK